MENNDTLPVWQKLYQIISGSNQKVIQDVLEEVLAICEEKLVPILLHFKPYTKESFEEWRKESKSMLVAQDDEMSSFVHRMSKELDLDVNLAWSVICNFLIFGYYGKVSDLKFIIRYESNIKSIFKHLWVFYTSDRMFLLKTLRFILEKLNDKTFIYHEQFCAIFEEIDFKDLWQNALKTFEYLLTEINIEKSSRVSEETLTKWIQRNNREQVEVLLLMTQLSSLIELRLKGDELEEVLKLFLRHGFGRHPLFFGAGFQSRPRDIVDIKHGEIGVVLSLIHRFWLKPGLFKMLPREIELDLEQHLVQGDNGIILFIWAVFKFTLSQVHMEYSRNVFEALLHKKAFKSLAKCITSNMFQNSHPDQVVMEATNRLFIEFVKLVDDHRFIYEQEGVLDILCELYKYPNLHALENLGMFVQIALDMFPYKLDNFLRIVEAIIISDNDWEKVIKLLHNCPTYCTEVEWPYSSDAVKSTQPTNLFLASDNFIIPTNTLTEKCNCFGVDVIKFHYKFDFFDIIGQFMRSLTTWAVNRGDINKTVFNYVIRANKFLTFLIKHYKGNFQEDHVIKPLVQRLDGVPTFFLKSGFKNFELFYVYFEAKSALIRYQNVDFQEAFPPMIHKLLFPAVTDYKNAVRELKLLQSGQEYYLYAFLNEEESRETHTLLLEYIALIMEVLKKDILHGEFLFSGIWYLLYVVFPSLKQWNYDQGEDFEQIKILNGCFQVFINILEQQPEKLQKLGKKEVYNLVHNAFINDPFIIDSLYAVFVKDKFYLSNLMHQESNWVVGKSLVVQDTVKQELLILLLIFKSRARLTESKCEIDLRTHIFAKSASVYFITPYNSTLSVLAGQFLDMLGRDENIPLMSCLGVDYDQIQTLFLERLRDPMEDEEVKLNILNLISTCILHQTGMTAAFFNVQSSKKWYNPDVKRIVGDTVGDFMMDYLQNIKRSVSYLKSPLQMGVLKVMANLWQCQKQHLIGDISTSENFWILVSDPLLKPFELKPLVYAYLIKILAIQFTMSLRKSESPGDFYQAVEKFMNNETQLTLFQDYLYKIFMNDELQLEMMQEREMLLQVWTELLVASQKQDKMKSFPTAESKYLYVELAFECLQKDIVHRNILSTWLDFTVVVLDMFGLKFDDKFDEITSSVTAFAKIVQLYYERMTLRDKRTALTAILQIIRELKSHYEQNPARLVALLEEMAALVDLEYNLLTSQVWSRFRDDDFTAKDYLGPWALILCIGNCVLSMKNCDHFQIWFSNRRYLDKLIECTPELLSHKKAMAAGELALHGLTLYAQSSLAFDFLKVNMVQLFDRVEPLVSTLISGQVSKINVLDLKEAWLIFNLLVKFAQAFLKKFRKHSLETCYAFLTLNQHILAHVTSLPENTVDFKALDLLSQTIILYHEILKSWKIEWYRKSNKTFTLMTEGIRKSINACIYLCLRPKHIGFYCLDNYYRLVPADQFNTSINDLMIAVIDRLIGILGLAFSCLHELNSSLLGLFEYYETEDLEMVLIENDFSVPRFELPILHQLTYGKLLCLAHFLCKTMNQLHQKKDAKQKQTVVTVDDSYIGLVEHQDPSDYMPDQKLSSFLRYLYEYSGLIDPWINNLNYKNVHRTADILMMFIAQQAFLTIKMLEPRQVAYYKRNLYSELQFFHEYIKKRTSELTVHVSTSPVYSSEMDHIKRYLLFHWKKENGKTRVDKVADDNFLLIISFWFSNICQIQ